MKRRKFLINSTLTSSALMSLNYSFSNQKAKPKYNFNLKYAPHLGMFVNHAGKDPLNQLKFMYEQGFTAFEDNNMKKRDVNLQDKLADFMSKNNIQMAQF